MSNMIKRIKSVSNAQTDRHKRSALPGPSRGTNIVNHPYSQINYMYIELRGIGVIHKIYPPA